MFDKYEISSIESDIIYKDALFIPYLKMDLYDGKMITSLLLRLKNGTLSYEIIGNVTKMSLKKLIKIENIKDEKLYEISFDFKMLGEGDISNLDGELNITQIGTEYTDKLLGLLDPNGLNQGINNVKLLLKQGYRPEKIRFVLKYGNINTYLWLKKPLISLPIEQPITITRLPLKSLLKNIKAISGK